MRHRAGLAEALSKTDCRCLFKSTSLPTSLDEDMSLNIEIGAYEAKTKLPELLRQVQAGKRFTITNRGKAIAELVPTQADRPRDSAAAIDRFLAFKKAHPVRGNAVVRALIEEGRE